MFVVATYQGETTTTTKILIPTYKGQKQKKKESRMPRISIDSMKSFAS
jgi:uncharacterized protein YccT (UPF0319 family)